MHIIRQKGNKIVFMKVHKFSMIQKKYKNWKHVAHVWKAQSSNEIMKCKNILR